MSEEDDFLLELKETFLDELDDILEQIESAFLRFEKVPSDTDILHEIFRYFHNVKGSSKTVGLGDLSHFAHNAENLLSKLRNGELQSNDDMVDCLLVCADLMRDYSQTVRDQSENPAPLIEHAQKLEVFLTGGGQAPSDSPAEIAPPAESPAPVASQAPASEQQNSSPSPNHDFSEGFGFFDEGPKPAPKQTNTAKSGEPTTSAKSTAPAKKAEEFIKVSMNKINQILDLFGEQVILQSALDHAMDEEDKDYDYIAKSVGQLKKITQDLQYTMVTLRMVSLETLFNRMERAVRDVSRLTNKKINFVKKGQTSELDKTIVDALIDPLTHMVRNAVDHGVESAEERTKNGKPETGTVTLIAQRSGGAFEIIVEDDGKGLNKEQLLEKAKAKGLVKDGDRLADSQVYELIFASGFSTLASATEISGRGVGMDVVRQQIRKLKGVCEIQSELGKGTKFIIRVPLSLAMFNGTVVAVNDQRYVIPNSDFNEALSLKSNVTRVDGGENNVIRLGDRLLRIIDLRGNLTYRGFNPAGKPTNTERKDPAMDLAIVAAYEDREYALLVNDILSQEQIVLKELGPEGKQIRGASGGTILGDGNVALVLDVSSIIKRDRIVSSAKAV